MKKIRDLLRLKFSAKLNHRQIGKALNISPGTVSYYTQAAQTAGITWPIPEDMNHDALIAKIEPVAKQLRNPQSKWVMPDWSAVQKDLSVKHMTLKLLWEDYAKLHPEHAYSYTQFTRHYKSWSKKQRLTMRLEHRAGEKAFVDYAGTTLPIYSRHTNNIDFKAQLFVMALGYSHYTFAYASRSQTLSDWIDAHKRAFRFFGGAPLILVPDNLKAGVTDSCQFEPEANPTYAELAEHYNSAIIPARPRTPQDKSIAENAVLLSSRWVIARLSKQKFYSLNALNKAISELLIALNHKPFQKRQGSRHQQFIEIEKAKLSSLPDKEYEFATLKYQTVPSDYHVRIENHYYSVPYTLVGETVLCRYTQSTVEILHAHQRRASHLRSFEKDRKTTLSEHMPKAHQLYQQWTPQVFLEWAEQIGSGVYNVAHTSIHTKTHPELCSKLHFGLKQLCKRFQAKRLNQACRRALVLGCIEFKSIKSIFEKGLDKIPHLQALTAPITPPHNNLRGPHYYQQQP